MLILIFSFFVRDVAADVAIRHLMSGDIIYLIPRTHRYDVMVWYMAQYLPYMYLAIVP